MNRRIFFAASALTVCLTAGRPSASLAQIVAPSTWATSIVIDPQPRDENGMPIGSPSSAAFDDWDAIPLAVADPADNPSTLNILDIADVKIANDANLIYIYASGHKMRTNGLNIAFDTDQTLATGFNIFGLNLVGSELGYVNDFVYEQRTSFNDNKDPITGLPNPGGVCCTGGPLDINNGGAALYPGWDVEFTEREWGIPLDAEWSINQPFGPTIPNPTFNFIIWTEQGLTDVTEVITYTLAAPPATPGNFDGDTDVDGADFLIWQQFAGTTSGATPAQGDATGEGAVNSADFDVWKDNFGTSLSVVAASAAPEPGGIALAMTALAALSMARRRR